MTGMKLRPWQAECADKAVDWYQAGESKHFLMNAAPGAGKTICASEIADRLINDGSISRVIVIAPRNTVVRQWGEEFTLVTGRTMTKITGADVDPNSYGVDVCATWSALQGLLEGVQAICRDKSTLVICDEHHHAAVEAAWGTGANGAFAEAKYTLILSGTPIRSDGKESVWLAYDDHGQIDHPEEGSFTLSYGEAVDLGYCRPATFHRHEAKFNVTMDDGELIEVSGSKEAELSAGLKRIPGLQRMVDYYRLACTPMFLPCGAPDPESFQASMLEWCINKLMDLRKRMPKAGGLVIAPSIEIANYMADLLEALDGEKPMVVHNKVKNSDGIIKAFRNNDKKWLVSVAMVSEGVDIPRLRVLAFLPNAQTELYFRQSLGRVVRNFGKNDTTRAYVVMPTLRVFEDYARRVEGEMSPAMRIEPKEPTSKICPSCGHECAANLTACDYCDEEFPVKSPVMKTCEGCGTLNPKAATDCQSCGASFRQSFEISLKEALREGVIARGMDIEEEEVQEGEKIADSFRNDVLKSGDTELINILRKLPEESYGRLAKMFQ